MRLTPGPILIALALATATATLSSTGTAAGAVAAPGTAPALAAAATPTHTMTVGGDGVTIYPAPSPAVYHYGIRTDGTTNGTVTVTATTSDPTGYVTIGSIKAGAVDTGSAHLASASATLTGLQMGDKVTVTYDDADGVRVDSLIYLPTNFPQLVATTTPAATGGPQPGDVLVNFSGLYATALDQNAVPVVIIDNVAGGDFKKQPNGNYSTAERVGGAAGYAIAEFDKSFHRIGTHSAQGLVNTDSHDSILEPNGNQVTISYEPNATDPNQWDAVIQEADAAGNVLFTWNSKDHFLPADAYVTGAAPTVDYMHINSIQITADGNFLASFRNLSAVVKIARSDGHVIWQLGGKHDDFTFVGDPLKGPCAQHTAYELPNGHLLLFDDGAKYDSSLGAETGDFCPDPAGSFPYTARAARPHSRAVEYALDEANHTATMVWDYDRTDLYTAFAGSTQRLANGNTLIDWAFNGNPLAPIPVATEVNAAKQTVWELTSPSGTFSYRAFKFASNDDQAPQVSVQSPQEGAAYPLGASVAAAFDCTDSGGSLLRTCRGTVRHGDPVDTSTPGAHTVTVTGTDHAGNTTVVERHYTVAPAVRPDAWIRRGGHHPWVGDNRYDGTQHVSTRIRKGRSAVVWVRLQNDGNWAQSFHVAGTRTGRTFAVHYFYGTRDVTRSVVAGTFTTPAVPPSAVITVKMVLSRRPGARPGDTKAFRVVMSPTLAGPTDRVAAHVRAVR